MGDDVTPEREDEAQQLVTVGKRAAGAQSVEETAITTATDVRVSKCGYSRRWSCNKLNYSAIECTQ